MMVVSNTPDGSGVDVGHHSLKARHLGIDTHDEAVVFMRKECHVCRAEGFSAHARVRLRHKSRSLIATLLSSDIRHRGDWRDGIIRRSLGRSGRSRGAKRSRSAILTPSNRSV